jgi:hypothetical protein
MMTIRNPPPLCFIPLLTLFRPFTFSKWKQDKKLKTYVHGKTIFLKMKRAEEEGIKSK